MELFTMDSNFVKKDVIDEYDSAIWTERYYGDGEVKLVLPLTFETINKFKTGTFVGKIPNVEFMEPMIIETAEIEGGQLTASGISLLKWCNNRFVRASAAHEDQYWYVNDMSIGTALHYIFRNMAVIGPYLDGTINTGIPANTMQIPQIAPTIVTFDGGPIPLAVPYGPLYDALRTIAVTYGWGIKIIRFDSYSTYALQFFPYLGADRSSHQAINPIVRLSPAMDSLIGIKELQSSLDQKNVIFTFVPSNPGGLASSPGYSEDTHTSGFGLRAELSFVDDITTDQVGGDSSRLIALLNERALGILETSRAINIVDGQTVPKTGPQYGTDYFLGDIVEMEGYEGVTTRARVTEYIYSKDASGEQSYPTLEAMPPLP